MAGIDDIVVVMDLGAAYTKIAIQTEKKGVMLFGVRSVPALPTVLYVGPNGETSIDSPPPPGDGWTRLEWFKLFLAHECDWPDHAKTSPLVRDADNRRREVGMDPVDVTATFLRHLWDRASGFISQSEERNSLQGLHVRLVVTLPGHWPADAARRMKDAISKSGIVDSVERVSPGRMAEPETAAIASLTDLAQTPGAIDRPTERDLVVVCDCGGITVDVATYEVTSTDNGRCSLDQRAIEDSRICGSAFIEDAFYRLLSARVRSVTKDPSAMSKVGRGFVISALRWWRTTLHTIVNLPDESESFPLNVELAYPGIPPSYFGGAGHVLSFTGWIDVILRVFDPMFKHIVELIEAQKSSLDTAARKYLLITGGMGSNILLQTMLARRFEDGMKILCWRDNRTWTAVARGAAMHHGIGAESPSAGLAATVRTHLARATYGLLRNENKVEWLIRKGDPIQTETPKLYEIPSAAVTTTIPARVPGGRHTLIICSAGNTASQAASDPNVVCSMTWESNSQGVSPSVNKTMLGITYDSSDGVAFGIYQNGQRLEAVQVDDSPF